MKLVYVAGPYAGKTIFHQWLNVYRAWRVARILWGRGYAAICPHTNSLLMDSTLDWDGWLTGDEAIIDRCDLVVFLPTWRQSRGARREMRYALLKQKDIVTLGHWKDAKNL